MTGHKPLGQTTGAVIGLAGIAVVTLLCALVGSSVPVTIPALLLLIPVAITSTLTSWRVAVPMAVIAALVYALAFIPPIGELHITFVEDVFVLITFVVVSIVVGALTGRRNAPEDTALIDDRRAVLLRGVSHDLRTPLTTIRAISTDLLDGDEMYDDGARHQLLGRVVDESERLDRIVGNLLSVSRVQAGALNPTLEPESIAQLVNRCVSRLDRNGSLCITTDIASDLPDVAADSVQVDQVLTNLIENALRHSPPASHVAVQAVIAADEIEVTIRDSGPGFSADARAHLFQPFNGADAASTGLGLVVSKAIVEAHGGTIAIRDEPTGGTSVSFTLPIYVEARADLRRRG